MDWLLKSVPDVSALNCSSFKRKILSSYRRGHEVIIAMPFNDKTDKYTVISSDPNGDIIKMLDTLTAPVLQKTDSSVMNMFSKLKGMAELMDLVILQDIKKSM